jgi:hypothetical protein
VSKVVFGSNSTQKNDFLNFSKYNILLQETYCASSERNQKNMLQTCHLLLPNYND